MTNNTLTAPLKQDAPTYIDSARLLHVVKSTTPEPRSMAAAMKRTGKSKEYLLMCNENSERFAAHRIWTAFAIHLMMGASLSARAIAKTAGASRNTVAKHIDQLKESAHATREFTANWKQRDWRNKLRWLARVSNRASFTEAGLQKRLAQTHSAMDGRQLRHIRGHRDSNSGTGSVYGERQHTKAVRSLRLNRSGQRNDSLVRGHIESFKVDQAVFNTYIQGGKSGDLVPFKVLGNHRGTNIASLSSEQRSGNCSETIEMAEKRRPQSGLSGTAIEKPDDAKRSPILYATNTETGEVICMENSFTWTPTPNSPKPPGNPFRKERSENKTAASTARTEPQSAPMPSPRIQPRAPHPSAMAPLKEDEIYVPCPEEIRAQIREFAQKFSMDKAIRDTKQNRAEKGGKLTHLQRVSINNAADEEWFRRNQTFVDAILMNRGRPDAV